VPWWQAHEVVSGITYFLIYLFIVRQRAWEPSAPQHPRIPHWQTDGAHA
jgi:hypothetical protein